MNLTSAGHRLSPVRFSDYNFKKAIEDLPEEERPPPGLPEKLMPGKGETYNTFLAYGQSKTANILFSGSLNEELGERGVRTYAVHPGCKFDYFHFCSKLEDFLCLGRLQDIWMLDPRGDRTC